MNNVKLDDLLNKATKYAEQNPIVVGASAVGALAAGLFVFRKAELSRDGKDFQSSLTGGFKILNNTDHTLKTSEFSSSIENYEGQFKGARRATGAITSEESVEERKKRYADMVNDFYNLVTDFYEWGWGQSFHFGPRFHNETFVESIKRTEYHLCSRLGMKPGVRALDVGCGVGGPMRNMAIFSGATIDGITINEYQVKIGNKYNAKHGLSDICKLTQGDFQNLPWPNETFDVAYAIEATCHSPDRDQTFGGIARVLKKGGLFAGYEWVMTNKYDANNKDHVRIKEGIEVGNGLPTLVGPEVIIDNLKKAGFEIDTIKSLTAEELEEKMKDGVSVFDVRKPGEYAGEHIVDVPSTPLDFLNNHLAEFPKEEACYLHCAGGYRSMIAASILKARGYHNVVNVLGGFSAIKKTGIKTTNFVCPSTLK